MTAFVAVMVAAPFVSVDAYTIDTTYNRTRSTQRANNNYVILHEIGVANSPAINNAQYFNREWQNAGTYTNFVVGDGGKVYQVAPTGYVSWGAGSYANSNAPVQIELARTNNKATFKKDYASYINLARDMAKKYGIPLNLDGAGRGIKSHYWVTQNIWGDHVDPWTYFNQWNVTKSQVAKDLKSGVDGASDVDASKETSKPAHNAKVPVQGASKFYKEKATFKNGNQSIQVRKNNPGLSATRAGILPAGAKINYDGWVAKDGYTWVRYVGDTGDTLYLPVRQGKTPWGTFSATGKSTSKKTTTKKSNATIANEVLAGKWGNGTTRTSRLRNAGYNPTTIQNLVNKKFGVKTTAKKSVQQVAREIFYGQGNWGNNPQRSQKLRNAGYNPTAVQNAVNQMF